MTVLGTKKRLNIVLHPSSFFLKLYQIQHGWGMVEVGQGILRLVTGFLWHHKVTEFLIAVLKVQYKLWLFLYQLWLSQ